MDDNQPKHTVVPVEASTKENDGKKNLMIFEEDMKEMPRVSVFLQSVQGFAQHTTYPSENDEDKVKNMPKKAKLGTVLGVYLPTIQHIFGVLMFVRLAWIVGSMGILQGFIMVFICCLTTFLTSISMSAVATNGVVQAGGSYFMISRNLGPECGGAIGFCFYLANTFATDLYLLGALEILLQYMAPSLCVFGDLHENPANNFRVYGTILVILLTLFVAVGVKFVAYFAPVALISVVISILCVFIGSFESSESTRDVWICMLGDRLLKPESSYDNLTQLANDVTTIANDVTTSQGNMSAGEVEIASWCHGQVGGLIWNRYCNITDGDTLCDPYYTAHEPPTYKPGIPGMSSGVFVDNFWSYYLREDESAKGETGDRHFEVVQDTRTTFIALCAIYFPSVTGIMTGSNMSGDLKDPQKSIPSGTILAQLTCSFVYLSFVLLFGATGEGTLLRDKYGHSQQGSLFAAAIAWPHHWVVLIGAFCSTMGAALQCLTSAPRLLQAIARDNVMPILAPFKRTSAGGEPRLALLLTAIIAECGILVGNLDYVAPLIDVCFLLCYGFVNLTVALQTILNTPHWRPRFKYYHWTLALLGVVLNLAVSITAGWYIALAALAMAAAIYKYVQFKGSEKEWGDGMRGLTINNAQKALLKLEDKDPHTKNWRPQMLVLMKPCYDDFVPRYRHMFSFLAQLRAGQGFTVVASVLPGHCIHREREAHRLKENIKKCIQEEKIKGFAQTMVIRNVSEGLNVFIQTAGLGGLKPNTVIMGWPHLWKDQIESHRYRIFVDMVRLVTHKKMAMLVPRGIENFPTEKVTAPIDIWWILHDGGMLILLAFLLQKHEVWRGCKIRIFTVAQLEDNSIQLKKDLEEFLYQLRIQAEVHVEEMHDSDISAYAVEQTLDMQRRNNMRQEMKIKRNKTIQGIKDMNHQQNPSFVSLHDGGAATPKKNQVTPAPEDPRSTDEDEAGEKNPTIHFTFSASDVLQLSKDQEEVNQGKLMRMHTAVKLNETIRKRSADSSLVILNFPGPPKSPEGDENYMFYLDVLTQELPRVLLVRGTGQEVVTIYS